MASRELLRDIVVPMEFWRTGRYCCKSGFIVAVILTAVVFGASGCGGRGGASEGRDAAPGVPTTSTASPQLDVDQVALVQAATKLDEVLSEEYPDSYGGVILRLEVNSLAVHRKQDETLEARVEALGLDVRIVYENCRFSKRELEQLVSQVREDEQSVWIPDGISISGLLPRPDASGLDAFVVTENLAAAQALFDNRYGNGAIQLTRGGPANPAAPDAIPAGSAPTESSGG